VSVKRGAVGAGGVIGNDHVEYISVALDRWKPPVRVTAMHIVTILVRGEIQSDAGWGETGRHEAPSQ
jgi:hypothetical protein